jgi:flagellar motor switch protein FliN/FliY
MDNQKIKAAAEMFAGAFANKLAESLTQAVHSPLQLRVMQNPDLGPGRGKPVHFRLTAEGALRGKCFLELYESQVAELGSNILGRPSEPFTDEHADALTGVFSKAMPGLAASLANEYGEISFTVDRVADLAFGGMLMVPLAASMAGNSNIPVLIYFDPKLLEALSSKRTGDGKRSESATDSANLKLVMDVELIVSLRFGQRQLPLREVLELANGSVIELDRQIDDPVELLLDGKVIARGEAVIVDGNYGLRVTEVPQPISSHLAR